MTKLICVDLETTGTDPKTCEVVQVGGVEVDTSTNDDWSDTTIKVMLCSTLQPIPEEATDVHKITDADVRGKPHFGTIAASVIKWLDTADIVVTFNGEVYDLPIIRRHTPRIRWRPTNHIDVYRLWQYLRRVDTAKAPSAVDHEFPASVMTGSLTAAHCWCLGRDFGDAHDAGVDCLATLDVLWTMTAGVEATGAVFHESEHWTLDTCVKLTAEPLPGDVDWSGKLKWAGDEVVFGFGKHKDKPVRDELHTRGYVDWMLGSDFPEDTREILIDMRRGKMPKRGAS